MFLSAICLMTSMTHSCSTSHSLSSYRDCLFHEAFQTTSHMAIYLSNFILSYWCVLSSSGFIIFPIFPRHKDPDARTKAHTPEPQESLFFCCTDNSFLQCTDADCRGCRAFLRDQAPPSCGDLHLLHEDLPRPLQEGRVSVQVPASLLISVVRCLRSEAVA